MNEFKWFIENLGKDEWCQFLQNLLNELYTNKLYLMYISNNSSVYVCVERQAYYIIFHIVTYNLFL